MTNLHSRRTLTFSHRRVRPPEYVEDSSFATSPSHPGRWTSAPAVKPSAGGRRAGTAGRQPHPLVAAADPLA